MTTVRGEKARPSAGAPGQSHFPYNVTPANEHCEAGKEKLSAASLEIMLEMLDKNPKNGL